MSPRGAGYLFGSDVVAQFNASNDIDMICRAHQLVMEGYKWHFNETVLTVWSAPNYCYRSATRQRHTKDMLRAHQGGGGLVGEVGGVGVGMGVLWGGGCGPSAALGEAQHASDMLRTC